MEVLRERRRIAEEVFEAASRWVMGLPFKATAILIGSYARGDFNLWSDVDLLLLSEDFKGNPLERLKALDVPPRFQVIPLTPGEFRRLSARGNPMAVEAAASGRILRDDLKLAGKVFPKPGLNGGLETTSNQAKSFSAKVSDRS